MIWVRPGWSEPEVGLQTCVRKGTFLQRMERGAWPASREASGAWLYAKSRAKFHAR